MDKQNTNDNLNFNVAAFLSSMIIESTNNNITKEIIENPRLLNKLKKNKNDSIATGNPVNNGSQVNTGSTVMNSSNNAVLNSNNLENQVISNRYYPSTS